MRSTEREFVERLPATALSGWPFRAIQRWLAPTADIKQVSIGKPQAGGGDQAVRSMWMWCFSEQWWGNKYGKSEHGKATNIVNKVTRSKQPNFEDLESWQLSLAIHSPTVLSGFLTAQITNQHQVFFHFTQVEAIARTTLYKHQRAKEGLTQPSPKEVQCPLPFASWVWSETMVCAMILP